MPGCLAPDRVHHNTDAGTTSRHAPVGAFHDNDRRHKEFDQLLYAPGRKNGAGFSAGTKLASAVVEKTLRPIETA